MLNLNTFIIISGAHRRGVFRDPIQPIPRFPSIGKGRCCKKMCATRRKHVDATGKQARGDLVQGGEGRAAHRTLPRQCFDKNLCKI